MSELDMNMQETGWTGEDLSTLADRFIAYLGYDSAYVRAVLASVADVEIRAAIVNLQAFTDEWQRRQEADLGILAEWEDSYQEQQANKTKAFFDNLYEHGWFEGMFPEVPGNYGVRCKMCGGETYGRGMIRREEYLAFSVCERCGHIVEF